MTEKWAVLEVGFDATPEDVKGKYDMLHAALEAGNWEGRIEAFNRPTYRSQVAWHNGTLTFLYEVGIQAVGDTAEIASQAFEILCASGIVENEGAVQVV